MTSKIKSESVTYYDTKLPVPLVSQYLDIEHSEERPRACGMACVYMIFQYFGTAKESLDTLIQEGEAQGGRGTSGWIHDYLVEVLKKNGHGALREEGMAERSVERFRGALKEGSPVIVSVVRTLFDQRDFHMLVLTGVRENEAGGLEGFFYNDPASLERVSERYVPLSAFYLSWRRMAIFVTRHGA